MMTWYVKTREGLLRMRRDERGVVSFEYVIVAAAIVGAVVVAFGAAGGTGPISTALTNAITGIVAKLPTAG